MLSYSSPVAFRTSLLVRRVLPLAAPRGWVDSRPSVAVVLVVDVVVGSKSPLFPRMPAPTARRQLQLKYLNGHVLKPFRSLLFYVAKMLNNIKLVATCILKFKMTLAHCSVSR